MSNLANTTNQKLLLVTKVHPEIIYYAPKEYQQNVNEFRFDGVVKRFEKGHNQKLKGWQKDQKRRRRK